MVASALGKMAMWIFNGMKKFFCWILLWFLDRLLDVWNFFAPFIPAIDSTQLQPVADAFYTVDRWIPASEMLGSMAAYLTVYAIISAIRMFRRFMPF